MAQSRMVQRVGWRVGHTAPRVCVCLCVRAQVCEILQAEGRKFVLSYIPNLLNFFFF